MKKMAVGVAVFLAMVAPVWGTTVVALQADARILNGGGPDGTSKYLSVYNQGTNIQRSVLLFDVGSIAPGQTILSAELTLYQLSGWGGNPLNCPMDVYRVTRPWVENEVSWLKASNSTLWATPGGDYVGTTGAQNLSPFATNNSNPPSDGDPIIWDVTDLVERWYTGGYTNNGLLLLSSAGNHMVFHSGDGGTPQSLWPVLTVEYDQTGGNQIPEPLTLAGVFLGVGGIGAYIRRRRMA